LTERETEGLRLKEGGSWGGRTWPGQHRRFLLFKLISFLDGAQLSIFCFVFCIAILWIVGKKRMG